MVVLDQAGVEEPRDRDQIGVAEPVRVKRAGMGTGKDRRVGAWLIAVRKARGVTQASLAELTGLRRNTISELEAGRSYPDWSTISRIAFALDADIRFVGRPSHRPRDAAPR